MLRNINFRLTKNSVILLTLLIIIALLSFFVVAKIVSAPSYNEQIIKSLDEKKVTVMKLAALTVATSTLISAIPSDIGNPVANQLAGLSKYFVLVLGAIFLEKMLLSAIGYISFKYIIPIACLLGILYLFIKKEMLRILAIKLAIFGIVIFIAIPSSVYLSDQIYTSYEDSVSQTLELAEQNNKYIEDTKEGFSEDDKNWIETIGSYISNITSKIGKGIASIVKKGEETFNYILEAIAVLIVTTCVIPLVTIGFFAWIIKIMFSVKIKPPGYLLPKGDDRNQFR